MFDLGKAIMDTINTLATISNNVNNGNTGNGSNGNASVQQAPHHEEEHADGPVQTRTDESGFYPQGKFVPSLDFDRKWRFNRSLLSQQDRELYDAIKEATTRCIPSVKIRCNGAPDPNYLMGVTLALIEDDPSLFYIDSGITVRSNGSIVELEFKYNRFLKDKDRYLEQMKAVARDLFYSKIRHCTNAFDAELAIHEYFVKNVTYDNTDEVAAHSPVGPLLWNKGVCEGISEAYCFIACACGIKTSMMSGILNNERHRWNIVEIDGQRYHLDVTSDLGGLHAFFNCDDSRLRLTHSFEKKSDCRSMVHNYYSVNQSKFVDMRRAENYIVRNSEKIPGSFEFMVENGADPQAIAKVIQSGLKRSAKFSISSSNNGCFKVTLKPS